MLIISLGTRCQGRWLIFFILYLMTFSTSKFIGIVTISWRRCCFYCVWVDPTRVATTGNRINGDDKNEWATGKAHRFYKGEQWARKSSIGIPTERVKELLSIFSYIVFWVVRSWWPEGIHCASHAPTESFSAESAYISLTSYIIESRSCWTNDQKGERWRHVGEWERKKDREKDRDPYSRQKPVLLEVTLGLFGRHVNAPAVISCLRSHYFFFHRIFASNSVFLSLFKRKSGWNWMEYWLSWVRARLHLHIC